MKRNPNFKADMAVFALIIFLLGVVFSYFVIEKDPDARLGLFGISIWVLVIVGAIYFRKKTDEEKEQDAQNSKK
jgi:Sec-independent protein secretion pathway component TatC